MSIALVAGSLKTLSPWPGTLTSPRGISPSATMTAGNKAFFLVFFTGDPTTISVSDNSTQAGTANTWTQLGTTGVNTCAAAIFYSDLTRNILSTDTVSISYVGTLSVQMNLSEWTGAATGTPVQVTAANTGTSSTPHGGALSTATVGDLIIGMTVLSSAQAASLGTDNQGNAMTGLHQPTAGSSRSSCVEYEIAPSAAIFNPGFTYAGSAAFVGFSIRVAVASNVAPVNTVAPAVTGTATIGSVLTTTNGTWTGSPAPTFTYQWQRGGVNIGGATASTYTSVTADDGTTVTCVVTGTNVAGNSTGTSNGKAITYPAPTNTVAPSISGSVTVIGATLTATGGTWTP